MSPTLLRPARPGDAPAIAAVKAAAARRAYLPFTPEPDLRAWLARRASTGFTADRIWACAAGGAYLVATDTTGRILGAGSVREETGPNGKMRGYLADVYVDPPRTGAGSALVGALLDVARERGWASVRCFILAPNQDAVHFFTTCGFTVTGRTPNAELPGDLLEMTADLTRPRP